MKGTMQTAESSGDGFTAGRITVFHWVGLLWKDWRLLTVGTPALVMVVLYGLLMLAILSISVEPGSRAAREWAGPLLWIVFWFTGQVLMAQSFEHERIRSGYTVVLAGLPSPTVFFWSKVLANFLAIAGVHAFVLVMFTLFFDWDWRGRLGRFLLVWLSAILGYVLVGHVLGALLMETRQRGLLFPLALFPVLLGTFMVAGRATVLVFQEYPGRALLLPLGLLWLGNLLNLLVVLIVAPRAWTDA